MTLTTVGYGDIVPRSEAARTMAVIEAVMGQIYHGAGSTARRPAHRPCHRITVAEGLIGQSSCPDLPSQKRNGCFPSAEHRPVAVLVRTDLNLHIASDLDRQSKSWHGHCIINCHQSIQTLCKTLNLLTLCWFVRKRKSAMCWRYWSMPCLSSARCFRSGSSRIRPSRSRSTSWRACQFARPSLSEADLPRPYVSLRLVARRWAHSCKIRVMPRECWLNSRRSLRSQY
jgi:hypothetical protein